MKAIVLASRNPHKIKELKKTLAGLGIELKSALDFPRLDEVEEDQPTLEDNALRKARYVYSQTGLPALADDTGLEVNAMDGRPGVFSARYAGKNATYQDNMNKLLEEMAKLKEKDRLAQFRTVVAFVEEIGDEHTFEGICRGTILKYPQGDKGFGYDPVFQPEGYELSFAQLDSDVKNRISHRGRAIARFCEWLRKSS